MMEAAFYRLGSPYALASGGMVLHYPGFGWWPQTGDVFNTAVCAALALSGGCVALGVHARLALGVAWLCLTHVLLYDASYYFNHIGLLWILVATCALLPVDVRFALRPGRSGGLIPRYALAVVVGLFWLSYLFGGLNKLRVEWLAGHLFYLNVAGNSARDSYMARWFAQTPLVWIGTYAGLLLDLGAAPLLAWRRMRRPMALALASFHLCNHLMFHIGLFSYLMVFAMVLYFDPSWPDECKYDYKDAWLARRRASAARATPSVPTAPSRARRGLAIALLAGFAALALAGTGYGAGPRWDRALKLFSWQPATARGGSCEIKYRRAGDREWIDVERYWGKARGARVGRSPALARQFARAMLCPEWKRVNVLFQCRAPGDPFIPVFSPELDACAGEEAFQ
jgi:hypothetical protein